MDQDHGMYGGGHGWSTTTTGVAAAGAEEEPTADLRRGPWTVEEDLVLMNYISVHGEGRWNSLARCAGLRRTGKSCRLRWLNYLRPDVRRGNITPEEQLLILELHSRWGNRWSKIAQYLPGRTDNEIKNYWRTRVQKHAKQLQCDVNSKQFKDIMRYLWMPRLVERIQASTAASAPPETTTFTTLGNDYDPAVANPPCRMASASPESPGIAGSSTSDSMLAAHHLGSAPPPPPPAVDCFGGALHPAELAWPSPCGYLGMQEFPVPPEFEQDVGSCSGGGDVPADVSFWQGVDDFWPLQQQEFYSN